MARFFANPLYQNYHYLAYPDVNKLTPTQNLTVSAWILIHRPLGDGTAIIGYGNGVAGSRRGWVFKLNGNGRLELRWSVSGGTQATGSGARHVPRNQWVHVAARVATRIADVYQWGVASGGQNTLDNLVTQDVADDVFVGQSYPSDESGTYAFSGALAEVAFWNAALSLSQLQALAAGESPRVIDPGNLAFYAPLRNGDLRDDIQSIIPTITGKVPEFPDRGPTSPILALDVSTTPSVAAMRSTLSGLGTRIGSRQLVGV